MRKRITSDTVNGTSSLIQENKSDLFGRPNFGKVQESSEKAEEIKHSKKKICFVTNQSKFAGDSDESSILTNKYSKNLYSCEEIGMVGSLRRTTSVPNSAGEENISSRRRTVTGSGENESKPKQEPLPDIMHDWEIIVKSLRGNQNETENASIVEQINPVSKISKSPNLKLSRSIKVDHTDSDKENSLLKKKNSVCASDKSLEFLSPSTSGGKTNVNSGKQIIKTNKSPPESVSKAFKGNPVRSTSPKTCKSNADTPLHDDSDSTWRRPTRSTYKAFENVFESPELVVPLETEFNGSDENEILAIKEILTTPEKIDGEEINITVIKKQKLKLKRLSNSPLRKLRNSKLLGLSLVKSSLTGTNQGKKRRGRPKKLLSNSIQLLKAKVRERKILKVRQLRKGLLRKGRSIAVKKTYNSSEARINNTDSKSACRELYVKIENLKIPDQEMDFIGFGSPTSERIRLKPSLRYRPSLQNEIIKEEILESAGRESSLLLEENKMEVLGDSNDTLKTEVSSPHYSSKISSPLRSSRVFSPHSKLSPIYHSSKVSSPHHSSKVCSPHHTSKVSSPRLVSKISSPQHSRSKRCLNNIENGVHSPKKVKEIDLSEFEKFFGCDEICEVPDFVGFPTNVSCQKTCLKCSLILQSSEALKQHRKVAHKRTYACPFDLGKCGQYKGSIRLHTHLMTYHAALTSFLQLHLNSDLQYGKISNWLQEMEGCAVCLMPLQQPDRCIHEILVHGIWPPSLLNLSSISIDQHVSLWWANHTLAFACHLCHTTQSSSRNATIPIVRSAPHCFPTLLSNHLRNVHLLNLPLLQGWFLTIKLLLSLPAGSRRTLVTSITLGIDSNDSYSKCAICNVALSFYSNITLHITHGLCNKCEGLCRLDEQCWFNCNDSRLHKQNALNHMLSEHIGQIPGAWCITCGKWSSNIILHASKCLDEIVTNCKFCSFKTTGISILKKIWHSLLCHIFPCPIPDCNNGSDREMPYCLPSAPALHNHLLSQHFPEWSEFNLDQISSLIVKSKKTQGVVLTKYSAQHLNGIWVGLSGHRHILSGGVLSPVDFIKVPMICILCSQKWDKTIEYSHSDKSALCSECTLLVSQCENEVFPTHCPVYRCLENISSLSALYHHLAHVHKLFPLHNNSQCLHCSTVTSSSLSTITHSLLKHKIGCLICPFIAPTLLMLQTHHTTMHGLPSWDAVYQHLKMEEFSRNKNKENLNILHGVLRIWQRDQGIISQWDSSLKLSELVVNNEERDCGGVINQSIQDNILQTNLQSQSCDINEVDSWCSSLCTVSMSSPNKLSKEFVSLEKDIKPDIFHILNKDDTSNDQANVSCNTLCPSVSVNENAEDSDLQSCASPEKSTQNENTPLNSLNILFGDQDNTSDSSDDNISNGSTYDRPLKIDSSVQSPESHSADDKSMNIDLKSNTSLTSKLPVNSMPNSDFLERSVLENSDDIKLMTEAEKESFTVAGSKNETKTPTFGLAETLSSVMEETLQSMSNALSGSLGNKESETVKTFTPVGNKKTKLDSTKGLGENAFIDEKIMAENILKDLEEKYSGTCVDCGNSILLPHLKVHIKSIHPGKQVCCSCGFKGELYATLVHSFHMSHLPNEARPIMLEDEGTEKCSMIVLEARPDLKTITYPCYKCSKRFKQEKSRQLHYNLCKLEKKFSCDVCGEKFALDNHLQKHKEWKHNPQICKHCGKTFNSSSSLSQHVLHIHKKPLSQRCRQCGDAFNTSKQLKVHYRIHTGDQPHSCKHCLQKFISRNLLLKHTMKVHKEFLTEKERAKQYKLNGGVSSSSDSSDSDESLPDSRPKFKKSIQNDNEVKVMALTESDLNTSSSDIEELSSPLPPIRRARVIHARKITTAASKAEKCSVAKSKAAGIYQDREAVSLPEMKYNVKAKVDSSVGRVCAPCGQEFDSPTAKLLHMYLIHPGLVLTLGFSECSFCDHKFSSADDVSNHHLDKHQRTPLSNGNFRCLCGLVFREDGAYYFHLYYAHKAQRALNIGGEIVCRLCEGRPRLNKIVDLVVHLSDRHTMFDHVRFNDSYMCNFCYKAFESWTVLSLHFFMVHKATKSQTLSYDCPYCQGASPWHSLEALQYHLDNVHRGRHTQSRPVPEHSRNIYTPAPAPSSPTKRKESKLPPVKPIQVKNLKIRRLSEKNSPQKPAKKLNKMKPKKLPDRSTVLYCICQSPYDEVSAMIGCDNTNCKFQWFHFECVGIRAAPEGNWYCPDCTNIAQQKQKLAQKQSQLQADLYEYYSNYSNDATTGEATTASENRSRHHSTSSNSSNSSNSSSSSSSNTSSSSSSSSGESSSASGDEN